MIVDFVHRLASRRFFTLLAPLFIALAFVAGCNLDGYPETLTYPPRTDAMVIGKPDKDAPALDRPGAYPNTLFAGLSAEERDKVVADPAKVSPEQRAKLQEMLDKMFGTPAHPKVVGTGDAEQTATMLRTSLGLDEESLAKGSSLYRQQCLHCHGLTGDGRGPTGPWVNPHPRDYRMGRFKFTSSKQDEGRRKPRKEDLVRTINEGIEGTSMPSFRLLTADEIEALAAFVIHLSLRGELEYSVLVAAVKGELEGSGPAAIERGVSDYLTVIGQNWSGDQGAQNSMIQPEVFPQPNMTDAQRTESVKNGYRLFIQQGGAGCISCHTDFGRQSPYKYDAWGTITKPIDLTTGIFRGGRRPIDLFWRVHSGINGSGMTAFGTQLSSKDIWDLVHFLQVLPYPAMRDKYGLKLEAN